MLLDDANLIKYIAEKTKCNIEEVKVFISVMKDRGCNDVDLQSIVKHWDILGNEQRSMIAISMSGIYHAMKFFLLIDYLSKK